MFLYCYSLKTYFVCFITNGVYAQMERQNKTVPKRIKTKQADRITTCRSRLQDTTIADTVLFENTQATTIHYCSGRRVEKNSLAGR